jgi:serine/threonine protein kinase
MRSLPGSRLLHYDILGPLGAGAMGEVYRARDSKLEREVAIKVLPAHFAADAERLKRFGREATTLASLNHPNVAQIFGVEAVDGLCFLVLELVPGESLEDRLKRGPLPIAEAIEVCRQIAEGLEAAHEAGVIHRDLKPANVRLTPDGKVKVLDFGLAKPARLLQRAFGIEVLVCPKCSGVRRVLAAIHDPASIARVLLAMGLPSAAPEQAGCRAPPAGYRLDAAADYVADCVAD